MSVKGAVFVRVFGRAMCFSAMVPTISAFVMDLATGICVNLEQIFFPFYATLFFPLLFDYQSLFFSFPRIHDIRG